MNAATTCRLRLEGCIKALEENPLLMGYKEFQVSQVKNLFDPEERLKRWEDDIGEVAKTRR